MMVNTIFASVISLHADAGMQGVAQGVSKMLASLARGLGPMVLDLLADIASRGRDAFVEEIAKDPNTYGSLSFPRHFAEKKERR